MEWPFYVPEQIEQRRLLREAKAARLEAERVAAVPAMEILNILKERQRRNALWFWLHHD